MLIALWTVIKQIAKGSSEEPDIYYKILSLQLQD